MPRRWADRFVLLAGFAALAAPSPGQAPGTTDKVTYRDRTQDNKVAVVDVADAKESAAGVTGKSAGKTVAIPPGDIVRIDYGALPGVQKSDLLAVLSTEDLGRDPVKVQAGYADLLKKAGKDAAEKTRRALTFREAVWHAKAADAKVGDDFRVEALRAADKLAAVAKGTKTSWEVWPASRTAARLYMELGDFAKAADLLGELAAVPDLPRDLRYDARLAEAAARIRADQADKAGGDLAALAADTDLPVGGLKERVTVLQAAAKARGKTAAEADALQAAVNAAADPSAKAVGYNFLGDARAALNQPREAMWAYLWVDAVYNQDADERVLAVGKLPDVFERLGGAEKDKAAQFRERLPRVRGG
jgi:hypothetical protein